MAYEMHEGQGALFRNQRKKKEAQPDYTGQCMIDGEEYWIAGWKRESKGGMTYLSLAFEAKEEEDEPGSKSSKKKSADADTEEDDIPF